MSQTEPMDFAEFVETATALVRQVIGRVPEQWRDGLLDDVDQGIQEPRIFLRNLLPVFTEDRVPITQDERDMLARLLEYRHQDPSVLARVNVVAGDTWP